MASFSRSRAPGFHAVVNREQGAFQDGRVLFRAFLGNGVYQHTQEVFAGFLFVPGDFYGVNAAAAESEAGVQGGIEQGVRIGGGLEPADNFKVEGHIAQECGKMKNGGRRKTGSHGKGEEAQALFWSRERTSS